MASRGGLWGTGREGFRREVIGKGRAGHIGKALALALRFSAKEPHQLGVEHDMEAHIKGFHATFSEGRVPTVWWRIIFALLFLVVLRGPVLGLVARGAPSLADGMTAERRYSPG